MVAAIEPAAEAAQRAVGRWGGSAGSGPLQMRNGISAVRLSSGPGELEAPASDAHIVSLFLRTETRHRHWRDNKPVDDGPVPAKAINIIPAGVRPRAVVSEDVVAVQVFVPHSTLLTMVESSYSSAAASRFDVIDPRFQHDAAFESIVSLISDHLDRPGPAESLWLDSLGAAVAARIIERWSTAADVAGRLKNRLKGGLTPRQCRHVVQYMSEHMAEKVTLQDLADQAHLSMFHFSRAFKQTFGRSPYAYFQKLRIDEARRSLECGQHDVAAIARTCGFDDFSYFSRAFRREFGVTPSRYVRQTPRLRGPQTTGQDDQAADSSQAAPGLGHQRP